MKEQTNRLPRPGSMLHGCGGENAPGERETRLLGYDAAKQTRE